MLNAWVGFAHPERKEIARYLLSRGLDPVELELASARIAELLAAAPPIEFPEGLAPQPAPVDPAPLPGGRAAPGRRRGHRLDCGRVGRASAGAHSRGEPAALAPLYPPFRRLPTQNLAPCAGGHVLAAGQLPSHPSGRDQRGVHQARAAP